MKEFGARSNGAQKKDGGGYLNFMKKLLGILVLSLLFCSDGFAGNIVKLPKDVASGNKYKKSLDKKYKKYGMQVVNKKDGHPVRAGEKSIRFEVRPGDCGYNEDWNDCDNDRERHELTGKRMTGGEWWYSWSIYLPKDFINVHPTKLCLGQFHQEKGHVVWMFQNQSFSEGGGYWVDDQVPGYTRKLNKILSQDEMSEKWNDILVNAKWSKKDDGFFKVWLNGKQVYSFAGPTKTKAKVYFKFGIYRSFLSKWIYSSKNKKKEKGVPAQVVYYDEVRAAAKSCKKLKLENLGYSCEELESKQISKIEKGETSTNKYMAVIKSKNNENYLLKINGATKKLAKKKGLKQCKEEGNTECYVHYSGLKPDYEM